MMKHFFTALLLATAIALPVSASANQPILSPTQTIAQAKPSKSIIQSRLDTIWNQVRSDARWKLSRWLTARKRSNSVSYTNLKWTSDPVFE